MKKTRYYHLLLLFAVWLVAACNDKEDESVDLHADVSIGSFSINGRMGEINQETSTITVVLPVETDFTALSPDITIAEGASVKPQSGQTVDFSQSATIGNEIVYTVRNKDVYRQYKVIADIARAKITQFIIGTVEADINEYTKEITIYLPQGTDLSALRPTISYTEGAVITPGNAEAVDFSAPVTYTLEYQGATFHYTVTVMLGEKPLPALIIYNGEDVVPSWAGLAGSVNSPYANPKTTGINPTPYCASLMRIKEDSEEGGKPWSGGALWNNNKVHIDPAVYGSFSVMVLKSTAGVVQLEIQSDEEQDKDWLKVNYSAEALGEWQELVFVIPEGRTAVINNILIAPHCEDPNTFETQRVYWDELKAIPR